MIISKLPHPAEHMSVLKKKKKLEYKEPNAIKR